MRRRDFLGASAGAAMGLWAPARSASAQASGSQRQYFEWRVYHFASAEKQAAYEKFLADVAIPAYNRAGVEPVGVWKLFMKDNPRLRLSGDSTDLYVFLTHKNIESVLTLENRLARDTAYQSAGQEILHALRPPAYTRYDSTLLLAMEGAPTVQVPKKSESAVYELRTYESPNNERAINKLEMFNTGEFAIFKKAGMPGVFFGGAIAGPNLPHLTYMVVHATLEDAPRDWAAFGQVPEWKTLTANPSYKGNVSKVINPFLRAAPGSQL